MPATLSQNVDVDEKRMFGGLAFMISGRMALGIVGGELMVKLGEQTASAALAEPHVREIDFTGRPMRSMVFVTADGLRDDASLARWIEAARSWAAIAPPPAAERAGAAPPLNRDAAPTGRRTRGTAPVERRAKATAGHERRRQLQLQALRKAPGGWPVSRVKNLANWVGSLKPSWLAIVDAGRSVVNEQSLGLGA